MHYCVKVERVVLHHQGRWGGGLLHHRRDRGKGVGGGLCHWRTENIKEDIAPQSGGGGVGVGVLHHRSCSPQEL